ncbi:MAG: hypothetical protein QOH31_2787 [Verrucomicrobiota bacterium]|jgi:hypothetical protein
MNDIGLPANIGTDRTRFSAPLVNLVNYPVCCRFIAHLIHGNCVPDVGCRQGHCCSDASAGLGNNQHSRCVGHAGGYGLRVAGCKLRIGGRSAHPNSQLVAPNPQPLELFLAPVEGSRINSKGVGGFLDRSRIG